MKNGTRLRLIQRPELATHLALDKEGNTTALCGAALGTFHSYNVGAVTKNGKLMDGLLSCLHHVDCKRCNQLFSK